MRIWKQWNSIAWVEYSNYGKYGDYPKRNEKYCHMI